MKLLNTVLESNKNNRACFISYVTAGDPNLKYSSKILETLATNGVDIIELGIPFQTQYPTVLQFKGQQKGH